MSLRIYKKHVLSLFCMTVATFPVSYTHLDVYKRQIIVRVTPLDQTTNHLEVRASNIRIVIIKLNQYLLRLLRQQILQ